MLEQGLSFILKGLLNDFIEDGDRLHEKVQVGLWSGYIVLEDLRIKSSVLSLLDVPLSLQYGYIGSLEIRIPFARLGSEPVTVVLNKLVLLLEPKYEWNEEIAAGKEQAIKQAKLAAAELFATNRLDQGKKGGVGGNWFVNALLSKIIDNIQITVRDVHIRYEDTISCPTDFCFGISFESLHLQSRDAHSKYEESITPMKASLYPDMSRNFEKELSINGADAFYKLAELNHMAFYWNPLQNQNLDVCSCKFSGRPDKEILSLMTKTIAARGNNILDRPRHKYILQPMDINAFFDCSMGGQKAHLRVVLAEMAIVLEDRQMREIISFALNMTNFMKLGKYSHLRPKVSVAEDKLAWFRYAGNVVLSQVKAKRKRSFTRDRFTQRIEDKLVYIELWRSRLLTSPTAFQKLPGPESNLTGFGRTSLLYLQLLNVARRRKTMAVNDSELVSLSQQALNEDTIRVLHFLERELEFQDLLYFRSIAEKMFSSEERKASWMGSLLSWASGGKSSNSEEDKRKLYEALKFEPENLYKGGSKDMDINEVNFIANVILKEGSVTLALSAPESATTFQQAVPFFKLKLTELKQKVVLMGGGAHVKAFVSLQEFEAFELLPNVTKRKKAPDTISHHIIHRRNLKSENFDYKHNSETESNLSYSEEKSISSASKSKVGFDVAPPLFSSTIEIFPPGNEIEVAVDLEVEEMEVWISPGAKWIDSIAAFSSWPEEQQYWSEMEMHAMNQLADFKSRVDAKVAYMMENHSSIKIEGKIQAPVLVIHDSRYNFGSGKADVLIVDLGTIYLQTEKLAKVERQKETETRSTFHVNQSISMLQSRSPHRLEDAMMEQSEMLQETDKNWQMLESEDLGEFQDAKMHDLESISKQLPFADSTFGFDPANDKSHRRSSGLQLPTWKPSNGEEKDDDSLHELFDIFQARVTKIEVYFIEVSQADIREYGHGLWNNSTELQKTVLIPGFEIYSEIQVSVLPWDPTIPPFKVYSSISEINVQISDAKIMRLLNFGNEIVKGSAQLKKKKVTTSTSSKRDSSSSANADHAANKRGNGIPFRFLENARRTAGLDLLATGQQPSSGTSVVSATPSAHPPRTISKQRTGRRRRTKSFGGSTAGLSYLSELRDNKSQRSHGLAGDQTSVAGMSRSISRMKRGLSELEYQASHIESNAGDDDFINSDDDDASFFSFDNNYDQDDKDAMIEDLKYQMTQRETMRVKLIQEIRLAENDSSKSALCEQLKADLIECEMHLHQLKISYVELLVANDEAHDDVMIREYEKEEMRDKFDHMFTPGPKENNMEEAPTTAKRDFTHAKENMVPDNNQMEEIHYNKELVFLQMTLGVINVDFEIPKHHHNPFMRTYRFSISGLGTKVRHKVFDTKVSMYLHEMVLSELLAAPGGSSMSSVPLITSDPSIFSSYAVPVNIRSNALHSSPDLLRIRYSISYGNKSQPGSGDVHQAQVNVGYLGLNLRWQKLTPLVEEFVRIGYMIETKANTQPSSGGSVVSSVSESGQNSINVSVASPNLRRSSHPSRISEGNEQGTSTEALQTNAMSSVSVIPTVQVAVKIDCISVTLMNDTLPLVNTTLTSLAIKADTLHRQHFSVKLVDLAVYDLHSKLETRTERYSRSALYSIGSSNVILGKNIYDNSLFLNVSSDDFHVTKDSVNLDLSVKLAGIVTVSDGSLMVAMCQMYTQVDKEIQSIKRLYPLKVFAPPTPLSNRSADNLPVAIETTESVTLPLLQIHTKVNSQGLKIHLPMLNVDGKMTTITLDVGDLDVAMQLSKPAGDISVLPTVIADVSVANIGASIQFKPLLLPFSVSTHFALHQYMSPVHTPMHDFAYRHFEDSDIGCRPIVDVEVIISKIGIDVVPELVSHLVHWQGGMQKLMLSIENVLQIKRQEKKPAFVLVGSDLNSLSLPDISLKAQVKVHSIEICIMKSTDGLSDCGLRKVIEDIQIHSSLEDHIVHADITVRGVMIEAAKATSSPLAKLLVSNSLIDAAEEGLSLDANQWIRVQVSLSNSSCDAIVDVGALYSVITPAEILHLVDLGKVYIDSILLKPVSSSGGNGFGAALPGDGHSSSSHARNALHRGPYAHPSSVPMRLAEATRSSLSNPVDNKDAKKLTSEDKHKLIIVDWANIFRAIPLSVNVDLNVHGVQIYLPVDPEGKHMTSEILKLGLAASLQCSLPHYRDFNVNTDLHDVAAVPLFRIDKHDVSTDIVLLKENPHDYSPSFTRSSSPVLPGDVSNMDDSDENMMLDGLMGGLGQDSSRSSSGSTSLSWERLLQQVMDPKSSVSSSHMIVDVTIHGRTLMTASSKVTALTDHVVPYQDQDVILETEAHRRSVHTISEIEVTKCEVKFFADYRPFLILNEQLVEPLVKRISQLDFPVVNPSESPSSFDNQHGFASTFGSPAPKYPGSASKDTSNSRWSNEALSIKTVSSVPELLGSLADVSTVTFTVSIPAVAVSIWNDINIHPIFFGQVMVSDVLISGSFQPVTDFHNVRLLNMACPPTENATMSSRLFFSTSSVPGTGQMSSLNSLDDKVVRDLFGASSHDAVAPRQKGKLNFMDNLIQVLHVKIDGNLSITYQNQRLLAIEPLIEPTELSVKFTQLCREDQTMAITMFLNNNFQEFGNNAKDIRRIYAEDTQKHGVLQRFATDYFNYQEVISSPIPPNLEVIIDKMNFNITTPLIQSIFTLVKSLSTVDKGYGRHSGQKHDKWESSMVLIRNEVGLPMRYWSTHDENHRWMLPPGEEVGWSASLISDETQDGGPRHLNISIEKPDGTCWPEIKDISFDGTGCRIVTLGHNGLSALQQSKRKVSVDNASANKGPVVILELSAKEGRKILVVRSSIRVFNATKSSMCVQFLESVPHNPSIAWELVLPPSKGAFVPINVCNVYVNGIVVSSSRCSKVSSGQADYNHHTKNDFSNYAGFIPCPEAVGMDSRDRLYRAEGTSPTSEMHVDAHITNASQNRLKRRKKLIQQKGTLNMTTHFHWIHLQDGSESTDTFLQKEEIELGVRKMHKASFLNAMIESRDAPSKKVQNTSELSLLRTIKFIAPVTIVNLMGKNVVVALYPCSSALQQPSVSPEATAKVEAECLELVPHMALRPGEAGESMALHASEAFFLALRLNDDDHYGGSSSSSSHGDQSCVWSSSVLVPGCLDHPNIPQSQSDTMSMELTFRNGSKLTILVEIVDKGGCRTVNLFTPFWIIPSSFIPLQFQHDLKHMGSTEVNLNGIDHLLADQAFAEINKKTTRFFPMAVNARQKDFLASMGRAKGMNGVILGPDIPLRGLADALRPLTKNDKTVRRIMVPNKTSGNSQNANLSGLDSPSKSQLQIPAMNRAYSSNTAITNTPGGNLNGQHQQLQSYQAHTARLIHNSADHLSATANQIIHCSYTNKEKKICRLKIRNRNTVWSGTVSMETNGIRTLRLSCASTKPIDDFDGDDTMNSPFLRDGSKFLELGISVQTLEAPFQRTKSIYVVDRYSAINLVGQTIEIKQGNQEPMLTLRPNEESTVWFRPDKYVFQVRLARYGWSWSGKFSITNEGEVPVRLRNDYDNTVFFILVNVHHSGPLVKIIFKSGDKYSPYRFENHSMETFKIKQRGQSLYTNLLPYHCCAYAWDEPLAPHQFVVCVQKPGQQMQDDWDEVGTFSFDRIESLSHKGQEYLVMQIITQGPTRVLQIHDIRISSSPLNGISSFLSNNHGSSAHKSSNLTLMVRDQSLAADSKKKNSDKSTTSSLNAPATHNNNASSSSSSAFTLFRLSLSIHLIGLSIIDQVPQEILYISFSDIAVEQLVAKSHHTVNVSIARFQIDNQLFNTPYPSMLHPLKETPSSTTFYQYGLNSYAMGGNDATHNTRKNSSIVMNLQQSFDYDGVAFFPHFKVDIAPFDVNIELNVIAALINLASYAYEEYQETTVISRQQVFAMGAAIAVNTYHPMLHQTPASSSMNMVPTTSLDGDAPQSTSQHQQSSRATRLSVYDLYDALSSAPIAMGLVQQKLSRTQIFSIYYQLSKHQQQHLLKQQAHAHHARDEDVHEDHHDQDHGKTQTGRHTQPVPSLAVQLIHKLAKQVHNIDDAIRTKSKVYFQHFEIGAFRMNISLHPIMSTEITGFENDSLLFSAVTTVVFAIASTFANIDNCPLKFPNVQVDHMFASSSGFAETLVQKYAIEAAKQAYLLLFSSQLLGNPVQLMQTLGEGLWDFINLPVMGLYTSPEAFVMGVLQGSLSLCRNIVASFCTTAGHLAQSLQVGLITLGAVDTYPRPLSVTHHGVSTSKTHGGSAAGHGSHVSLSRAASADNLAQLGAVSHPSSASAVSSGHGSSSSSSGGSVSSSTTVTTQQQQRQVLRPNGLLDALKMGIFGVIWDPWYGFQQDGVHGLVVGFTKGSVGLLARPLYGTLGVTSSVLEALSYRLLPRFLAHQKMRLSRIRPPRFFAHANVPLQVYSAEENIGQELLARVEQGAYRNDGYLWHGVVQQVSASSSSSSTSTSSNSRQILLLTRQRLLLLEDFWQYTGVLWQCPVRDIVSLEVDLADSVEIDAPAMSSPVFGGRIDTALQMLHPSTTSATSSSTSFASSLDALHHVQQHCRLVGRPVLSVYHVPQQHSLDKSPMKSTSLASPTASSGNAANATRSPGFRLSHGKVRLPSHEALLTLLHRLLPIHTSLASADIVHYLEKAGVLVEDLLSLFATMSSSAAPTTGAGTAGISSSSGLPLPHPSSPTDRHTLRNIHLGKPPSHWNGRTVNVLSSSVNSLTSSTVSIASPTYPTNNLPPTSSNSVSPPVTPTRPTVAVTATASPSPPPPPPLSLSLQASQQTSQPASNNNSNSFTSTSETQQQQPLIFSPKPRHFHPATSAAVSSFRSPSPILPISSVGMSLENHHYHHHHHHPNHHHLVKNQLHQQLQLQQQQQQQQPFHVQAQRELPPHPRPVSSASLASSQSSHSSATNIVAASPLDTTNVPDNNDNRNGKDETGDKKAVRSLSGSSSGSDNFTEREQQE